MAKEMKLSEQAMGAVMMALQKSLLEESDIVPVLKGFKFKCNEKHNLFVLNPPLVKFATDPDADEDVLDAQV